MTNIKDLQGRSRRAARALTYLAARRTADRGASRRALLYLTRQLALSGDRAAILISALIPFVAVSAGLLTLLEISIADGQPGQLNLIAGTRVTYAIILTRIALWVLIAACGVFHLHASARSFARGLCDLGRFLNWRADYTARLFFASTTLGAGAFMLTPQIMNSPIAWAVEGGLGIMAFGLALAHRHHRACVLAAAMPAGVLCLLAALYDGAQIGGSALLFGLTGMAGLVVIWRWLFAYACHLSTLAVLKHPAHSGDRRKRRQCETGYNPYQLARERPQRMGSSDAAPQSLQAQNLHKL